MIRLPRTIRKRFPIFSLAMAMWAFPVLPSDLGEPPLSPQESKVPEEYSLYCRPGRFIEDVWANLERMQQVHPGSTFLMDSAFLAEVHYLDRNALWNGAGKKLPVRVYSEMFDTLFNGYAPSQEAWSRSRLYGGKANGFATIGVFLAAANATSGIRALFNEPPRSKRSLVAYRSAQIALPIGWISSFIYGGICSAREDREFDNAFFESNGRAIARRLAQDL